MTDVSTTCAVVIFRVKVSCITSVDGIILWLLVCHQRSDNIRCNEMHHGILFDLRLVSDRTLEQGSSSLSIGINKTRPPALKLPQQPHCKRLALNNSRPNTCFMISLSKPALKRASKWNLAVAETNLNKSLLFIT